ncbi:DNA replication ATP-dependent helicase/nuclease JHS1 isoform X2 [Phoenix dactylifera]|uniref:DNA replication ATP-dependent helicase/nuclease n=1 Tax=Phoenix dactylifera TaxID=42345 RepID=A0A8B7MTC8_PHODC|nr:DNA replication ATP-dependent helicase/nuclease JHS1 isoform X2 [Phoenix dactylifera]
MAPRKRASSSSTRKPGQNHQTSQPSKFGIQHFFERHSQAAASSSSTSIPSIPPNPNPDSNPNNNPSPPQSSPSPADPPLHAPASASNGEESSSQITPEISKSVPHKRFKFSPGMLIKQSQDDGGDEVTWKISPVNMRLQSLTAKQLPRMARIFSEATMPNGSTLHPCSQKQDPSSSVGKIEKWLSSPATMAPDRSLTISRSVSIQESEVCNSRGFNGDLNNDISLDFGSPFRTPPSMSYGPNELIGGVVCTGASHQLGLRQHRKALLELLDQVEDAIMEEPTANDLRFHKNQDAIYEKIHADHDPIRSSFRDTPLGKPCGASHDDTFLVLEVSEKHRSMDSPFGQSPLKVLRLLNEQTGQERILHLCDEWFYSPIGPGDTINVIGEFDDQGKCVVNHNKNLVIVHPDILVSGTRVASSFTCPRRAVLDERLKSTEHSTAALIGTMLHQIFQAGLLKDLPSRLFLEEYAGAVLQKNIENLYACGANERDTYSTLVDAVPKILNWLTCFREAKGSKSASVDFGSSDGPKDVSITEVMDIEEMAWAPRYGLKGIIDASVRVNISSSSGSSHQTIMPMEFKSGKGTSGQSAMEHSAQVILYTLLMSERYLKKDVDSGLLYYLHTDQTRGIKTRQSDLVGIIMRRNELATDILKASTTQNLPPMLRNPAICKSCRHLNICTLYHKAYGGSIEGSGLGDVFDSLVNHLTVAQSDFLKHWGRLIDLEAKASQVTRTEILRQRSLRGDKSTNSISSIVLDVMNGFSVNGSFKNGRYIYQFVHQKLPHGTHSNQKMDPPEPGPSKLDCSLRCGDYVILSTESGRIAVAKGVICDISQFHISVSFPRRLRLPGSDSASETGDLIHEVWRLDKDEVASSYTIMRFNLIQLFSQDSQSLHLRKMIVDLEAPRFESGGIYSQDPALSYVRQEKHLNDDQRRSIHKILTAKDYALILGMPGTGKTSTMVHAVKALLMRGASILLTSYTNSAIDNLLIKLKAQEIDFIRIGRHEAVHNDIRDHCFSEIGTRSVDDIKQRMEHVQVVGVTCLGINHPLLANKKFDICIMDEAGQTTLPVSLGPLMLASTFVLVGDHYQLPPLVQSTEARENGMGISLFCRLSEAHPEAISSLQCQYRMCASIMELSNELIYGGKLCCGSSEIASAKLKFSSIGTIPLWLKEILDPKRSVVFINTDQLPALEAKEHNTVNNPAEAFIISEITRELVKIGIIGDEIGIITPYNSQVNLIREVVGASVEVQTIDKYQGRDKDCILLSFVRSTKNSKACTSSLLGDWHRINVALTRAKKKLIMVGSCKTLSRVPLLRLLIEKVDEQGGIIHISGKDIHHLKELKKCSQMSVL